jgi:hypothetical protein
MERTHNAEWSRKRGMKTHINSKKVFKNMNFDKKKAAGTFLSIGALQWFLVY